MDSKRIKQVDK